MEEIKEPVQSNHDVLVPRNASSLAKIEVFIYNNSKNLIYVFGGIVLLIAAYYGYKEFVVKPAEKEAVVKMFKAQRYFDMDSMNWALKGDGKNMGFEAVAEEYSSTDAGKLAKAYCGLIYLKKGKYDDAINSLEGFNSKSPVLGPLFIGALGDAYCQKKDYAAAAKLYSEAAHLDDNQFTSPRFLLKAGKVFEELKQPTDALNSYQELKDKYPNSIEGTMIDKFIGRAQASKDAMAN